ncbi:MAG: adenosylcobinamide-GDP ribazoletransferase [Lachnospiraceae bacterium]|nr:adenosylcobinamide-GDP ribazoletransferase [Lachnospiraceae bacterium]
MHILKSLVIAFSIYTTFPVPQFEWKEEDMQYMLCFFPWIGAVIGGCVYLWSCLCAGLGIGQLCYAAIGTAIPLILTGGFHVDGFMDTMDAFHSYQPRERKLEILKDSHIGAFAVIMLAGYGLLYLGAFSEITDDRLLKIVCGAFFLSRCLSGISVVTVLPAKKEGMLFQFADSSQKHIVKASLYLQGAACICFMLAQSVFAGAVVTAAACLTYAYYCHRVKRELGGITGDTAGYFVLICEGCVMIVAAVLNTGGVFS